MSLDDADPAQSRSEKWFGIGVRIAAFIILTSIIGALLVFVIGQWNNPEIRAIVTAHLQATIGLPVAGVFAFLVVALFERPRVASDLKCSVSSSTAPPARLSCGSSAFWR
jgi:F0F1-type ATP synthase membrane subunit a